MNSKWMGSSLACGLLLLLALALTVNGLSERELQGQFNTWMRHNARSYDAEEFVPRYLVWRENMAYIEEINREGRSYTVAMNEFGDLTSDEFARLHKGQLLSADAQRQLRAQLDLEASRSEEPAPRSTLPAHWDWRTQGAVTEVKNQGSCAACWAFVATGAIEGARKIAGGSLVSLSEQMLLDCAVGTGNQGCSGGNVEITYRWMLSNNARAMPESSYPYTGRQSTCRYAAASGVQGIGNLVNVRAGSESDLLQKAAIGPVTVAIDASHRSFQFYSGGLYNEAACSTTYLDHAVLVVGWGTDATQGDYWLVKNQWGASWGDSGYAYMARNSNNNCGIASLAVLPCLGATCPTTPNAQDSATVSPAPSSLPAAPSITPNASPASGLPVAPTGLPVAPSPAAPAASRSPASSAVPTSSPSGTRSDACYCQCGCGDGNPNNICFCPCPCSAR